MGTCRCGCGRRTRMCQKNRRFTNGPDNVAGEPLPFWGPHRRRPRTRKCQVFPIASNGRCFVRGQDGSRTYWYRIVAQNVLGRQIDADEIVHHIDGDITNDRPENLAVISRADHPRVHYATVPLEVEAIA